MSTVTPQAVSAYLRRNGFLPVPNETSRQGVKVTRSVDGACVRVDLDLEGKARRWADELADLLAARYAVTRNDLDPTILYVATTPTEEHTMSKNTTKSTAKSAAPARGRAVTAVAKGRRIRRDRSYTIAEAAELVGTSTFAVWRWVNLGYVEAEKVATGKGSREAHSIPGASLADFLKERAAKAKKK